jgi:hypothetical protein
MARRAHDAREPVELELHGDVHLREAPLQRVVSGISNERILPETAVVDMSLTLHEFFEAC